MTGAKDDNTWNLAQVMTQIFCDAVKLLESSQCWYCFAGMQNYIPYIISSKLRFASNVLNNQRRKLNHTMGNTPCHRCHLGNVLLSSNLDYLSKCY